MDPFPYLQEVLIGLVGFGAGWLVEWIRRQVRKPTR